MNEEPPPPKNLAAAVEVQPDEDNATAAADAPSTCTTTTSPSSASASPPLSADILDIQTLLWGATIKADIFERWSQGFCFSAHEPSALVQLQGGPCAIIAPVQAFLLHLLLADGVSVRALATLSAAKCRSTLVRALCAILAKCGSAPAAEGPATEAGTAAAASAAPPAPHRYRIVMSRKQTVRATAGQSPRAVVDEPPTAASPPGSVHQHHDDDSHHSTADEDCSQSAVSQSEDTILRVRTYTCHVYIPTVTIRQSVPIGTLFRKCPCLKCIPIL